MKKLMQSKLTASAIHLLLSFLLVASIVAVLLTVLYPSFLHQITGVYGPLKLMFVVDVILGPLLTFCIYNKAKKSLKFDLTVIVVCQLLALAYAVRLVVTERPAYLVFERDMFHIIKASEVDVADITDTGLKTGLFAGPQLVYVEMPSEAKALKQIQRLQSVEKRSIMHLGEYYQSVATNYNQLKSFKLSSTELKTIRADSEFIGQDAYKLLGKNGYYILFINSDTKQAIATIKLKS